MTIYYRYKIHVYVGFVPAGGTNWDGFGNFAYNHVLRQTNGWAEFGPDNVNKQFQSNEPNHKERGSIGLVSRFISDEWKLRIYNTLSMGMMGALFITLALLNPQSNPSMCLVSPTTNL